MKLAIMQPYFFPYIGYFQMIGNSDVFISYDTVDYIQRGWINRNQIIISKESKFITVPVNKTKLKTPITDIKITNFIDWKGKFLKTIEFAYKKAPYFDTCFEILNNIILDKEFIFINDLALESIKSVSKFLELKTKFVSSSSIKNEGFLSKESKLEFYIKYFKADTIIMPSGSKVIYEDWKPKNCIVKTMKEPQVNYNQYQNSFISNLSIIDVLMYNSKSEINNMIKSISFI